MGSPADLFSPFVWAAALEAAFGAASGRFLAWTGAIVAAELLLATGFFLWLRRRGRSADDALLLTACADDRPLLLTERLSDAAVLARIADEMQACLGALRGETCAWPGPVAPVATPAVAVPAQRAFAAPSPPAPVYRAVLRNRRWGFGARVRWV